MVTLISKNTEIIIEEKGYKRKPQPKVKIQKYNYSKEETQIGSKKEKLKMNKILKEMKEND